MHCLFQDLPPLKESLPLDFDPSYQCVTHDGDRRIPLLSDVFSEFPAIPINLDVKTNSIPLMHEVGFSDVNLDVSQILFVVHSSLKGRNLSNHGKFTVNLISEINWLNMCMSLLKFILCFFQSSSLIAFHRMNGFTD